MHIMFYSIMVLKFVVFVIFLFVNDVLTNMHMYYTLLNIYFKRKKEGPLICVPLIFAAELIDHRRSKAPDLATNAS